MDGFRCATISEAIMTAILSMALVLGVCGLAGAADDKVVDPVGTWKCEYEIGGQQRTSTLKIKKDGDNLTGTMSWPDQGETKLSDLKLKDGTLTFSAVRKLAGMDDGITVEYKLKIDGDKLEGKGAAEFGGEKRSWDMKATTVKKGSSTLAAKSSDHERIRGSNCCGWFDGAAASSRGHRYAKCSEDTNPIAVDSCRAPCRCSQCLRR